MTTEAVIEQNILAGSQFTGTNGGSTGTITTVAGSAIVAAQSFFLEDGLNTETEFVFVTVDQPSTELRRFLVITGSETTSQIRDLLIRKINQAPRLNLLALDSGASVVGLLNRLPGSFGNVVPSASTVGGGFAVSAMTGGVDGTGSTETVKGMRIYDPAAIGGILDFAWLVPQTISGLSTGGVLTWVARWVNLQLTDATTWDLRIVQKDGTFMTISDETIAGGNSIIIKDIFLIGDERLVLITAGASLAMRVRVCAMPDQILPA